MEIALHVHVVRRILSNISGYTGPIFTIFSTYESALCADDGSLPYFPISQGTLPWQPNHLWMSGSTWSKNWHILSKISGYTGPIFEIFSPYESFVCVDDGTAPYFPISQGTLPWQPNHLWMSGTTRPKNWRILSNISGYTGPIFAIFSPYESSMYRWWICTFFQNLVNFRPVI